MNLPPQGNSKIMTIPQAIEVATEIIRENRNNGELEGTLNRHRIAALNLLVRVARVATTSREVQASAESQIPQHRHAQ
jgi:hypothetical protein